MSTVLIHPAAKSVAKEADLVWPAQQVPFTAISDKQYVIAAKSVVKSPEQTYDLVVGATSHPVYNCDVRSIPVEQLDRETAQMFLEGKLSVFSFDNLKPSREYFLGIEGKLPVLATVNHEGFLRGHKYLQQNDRSIDTQINSYVDHFKQRF